MILRRCAALAISACLLLGAVRAAPADALENMPLEGVDAKAVMLLDAGSGQVIFAQNEDQQLPIASITKVMSLLVVMDALDAGKVQLDQGVVISPEAAKTDGSNALLDANFEYKVRDLIKSVIVSSANDATVALAETVAGSEAAFVKLMNRRAQEMGMADTAFANCTGLPDKAAHATARDVATMSRALLAYPLFHEFSGIWLDKMTHKNGRVSDMVNTNRLVRFYEGTTGVKTGSTSEAGYCVSASAKRGDLELIAVVLGSANSNKRFTLAQQMLTYGFDHYRVEQPVAAGDVLRDQVVVRGRGKVDVVASQDVRMLVRKDEERQVTWVLEMPEELQAPLENGQEVGRVIGLLGDEERVNIAAVAKGDLSQPSIWDGVMRILDAWGWHRGE